MFHFKTYVILFFCFCFLYITIKNEYKYILCLSFNPSFGNRSQSGSLDRSFTQLN